MVKLTWTISGSPDSYNIYRSDSPIDIKNLPNPLASGVLTLEYEDTTTQSSKFYYYRVESVKAGLKKISDELGVYSSKIMAELSEVLNTLSDAYTLYGDQQITYSTTAGGINLTAVRGWQGGSVGLDNKIYCVPAITDNSSINANILIYDPATDKATLSKLGLTFNKDGWWGCAMASNGKIYASPSKSRKVLVIDTTKANTSAYFISTPDNTLSASEAGWYGAVKIGKYIIFPPANAKHFLVVDTTDDSYIFTDFGLGLSVTYTKLKFQSAIELNNNTALVVPMAETYFIKLTLTDSGIIASKETLGLSLSTQDKWYGSVRTFNNKVIMPNGELTKFCIIDLATMTAKLVDFGLSLPGYGFAGIANLSNGWVIAAPHCASYALAINPVTEVAVQLNMGSAVLDRYLGALLHPNGKTYLLPCSGGNIGIVKPTTFDAIDPEICRNSAINKY